MVFGEALKTPKVLAKWPTEILAAEAVAASMFSVETGLADII